MDKTAPKKNGMNLIALTQYDTESQLFVDKKYYNTSVSPVKYDGRFQLKSIYFI